jgi:hypothetical protein
MIHIGFPDPTKMTGGQEKVFQEFRRVRDDMSKRLNEFVSTVV